MQEMFKCPFKQREYVEQSMKNQIFHQHLKNCNHGTTFSIITPECCSGKICLICFKKHVVCKFLMTVFPWCSAVISKKRMIIKHLSLCSFTPFRKTKSSFSHLHKHCSSKHTHNYTKGMILVYTQRCKSCFSINPQQPLHSFCGSRGRQTAKMKRAQLNFIYRAQ